MCALLQPPDQVQRFEGGDAAADDQGDAGVRPVGARPCAGGVEAAGVAGRLAHAGGPLDQLPQDDADFLLDGAAVLGRAEAQIGFDGVIEFSDGQAGHGGLRQHAINAIIRDSIAIIAAGWRPEFR